MAARKTKDDPVANGDPRQSDQELSTAGQDVSAVESEDDGTGNPEWVSFRDLEIVQQEKNELEDDLVLAQDENKRLQEEVQNEKERATALEADNERLQSAVQVLENDLTTVFDQLNNNDKGNEGGGGASKADVNAPPDATVVILQQRLRRAEEREKQLTAELDDAKQSIQDLEKQLKAEEAAAASTEKQGTELGEQHEAMQRLVTQLQDQIDHINADHDADMRKYAEEAQATIEELQSHVAELKEETQHLNNQLVEKEQEITQLQRRAPSGEHIVASTPSPLSRSSSPEKLKRPWRPPSANGGPRPDYTDDGRIIEEKEMQKMSKPQLLKTVDRMQEEIQWLNACLTSVREQRRDEHVRLPKRRAAEFVFATETRAKEKELHKNMHVIVEYLQKLGVPPEAPTWRQLVVLYQTCQDFTEKVLKTEGDLNEAVGELDTLRSVLGIQDGMSSINTARRLISKLSDLESDNEMLNNDLKREKEMHERERNAFDEQLRELDNQLANQGQEYQDTLKLLEDESTTQIRDFEHRLAAVMDAKDTLHNELGRVLRDLERAAASSPDAATKTSMERCMEHIRGAQTTVPRGELDTSTPAGARSPRGGVLSAASPFSRPHSALSRPHSATHQRASTPSRAQRLAPARATISRSPQRAPEVVGAAGVLSRARAALQGDPNETLAGLKRHMVEQERRHQGELRDLMQHTEELHKRQKERLNQLADAHDASENDLYQRTLQLEVEVESTARERDDAEAQLRLAEANVQRLQAATEENHDCALELQANFEAEMQSLQEVLQREKERHEEEVQRLREMVDSNSDALVRECRSLEQQLERQEELGREKDKEISRLMGEFRNMRDSHAKQYEELEKSHEEEMVAVAKRNEQELQKQSEALREAYDTVQDLATREKTLSDHERELTGQVDSLRQQLEAEQQRALDEREQLQTEHQRDVAHLQDMVESMKARHAREVGDMQHDLDAVQADLATTQDRAQALSTALDLKEEELASAREAFEEERKTFKESSDRLRRGMEQLESEVAQLKSQHGAESRELSAANTRQTRALEEANEARAALEARVQNMQREMASTQSQLEQELAREQEGRREDVARERQQRGDMEAAFQRKVAALVEERDALRRDLERAETQLQEARATSAKASDEASTEVATLKSRQASEVERLEEDLRKSEAERTEASSELQALRESVRRHFEEVLRRQPAGEAQAREPVEQLRTMTRVHSETEQQRDSLEARVRELEKAVSDYRDQVDVLRGDVEAKEDQVSQLQSSERVNKNNAAALRTRLSTTEERAEALERENSDLRARIGTLQEELGEQSAAASANQAQLSAVLDSVKQGFATEKQNFHKQVEGLRGELYEAQDRVSDVRAQLRDTEQLLEKTRGELSAAAAERDGLKQALHAETTRREKAEDEAAHAAQEAARLGAEVSEAVAQVKNRQGELEHTGSLLSAVQADLDRAREESGQLKDEVSRLKGELQKTTGQLSEHEASQKRHRNTAYEVEVLRREVDEQRRELERAQQQNLQQKAQANRDKRNNAAVVADLERQIEVLKARHTKEREALMSMDAKLRGLSEEKAKAERETGRQREVSKNLQGQLMQQVSALREKERQAVTLKKRVAALEEDLGKLQLQKRSLESRTRRDQSRFLSDMQRHTENQDRSLRVLDRARDQSLLSTSGNASAYDSRMSGLGYQMRKLQTQVRQERMDAGANSSLLSTGSVHSPYSSRLRGTGIAGSQEQPGNVLSSTLTKSHSKDRTHDGTLFLKEDEQELDETKQEPDEALQEAA